MIEVILLLITGGIGLGQAVSDPRQVAGRWLLRGTIIATVLLTVAAVAAVVTRGDRSPWSVLTLMIAPAAAVIIQLWCVWTLAWPMLHRMLGGVLFIACVIAVQWIPQMHTGSDGESAGVLHALAPAASSAAASGLLGGFLMTMLLGHAYLTAGGEMTQRPFRRLTIMLAVLLVIRLAISAWFGLRPWVQSASPPAAWDVMLVTARGLLGFVAPAMFIYMIYDCVRRRANQSATGILYVALVMVIIGEGTALSLAASTGFAF